MAKRKIKKINKTKATTTVVNTTQAHIIKKTKLCPDCNTEVQGRKTRTCPKCGHKFVFKKGKWEIIKQWKTLKKGDTFYLKSGSKGPYFNGENGMILMGYRGKFVVRHLDTNGIEAYSSHTGFAFIYMGPDFYNINTGIHRRKYILFKRINRN